MFIFCFHNISDYVARKAVPVVDIRFVNMNIPSVIFVEAVESADPQETVFILIQAIDGTVGKSVFTADLPEVMSIRNRGKNVQSGEIQ